jgi:DNA-binding response OmpR family regulator
MTPPCVLLVEGDILVRHPLAEYLRECGYKVLEAVDAEEARALLERNSSSVDVVLAEAGGDGESGFELASWIRRRHPKIEVALAGTVAKATERAADLCVEGPALSMPYDHRLVLDHIRRLLAARDRNERGD